MTNEEKYTTAEERTEKFNEWYEWVGACKDCPVEWRKQEDPRYCIVCWLTKEYKPTLRTCPFCGGEVDIFKDGLLFFIGCIGCGATPHKADTEDKAIKLWNRRAQ